MAELRLTGAHAALRGRPILRGVDLAVNPGELAALVGANGAGKTTLLRACLGLQRLTAGDARLDGREAATIPAAERARLAAYLPQARPIAWPIRVRDCVALGRFAHGARPDRLGPADQHAVERAMASCSIAELADRSVDALSGGERARVHVARALAAQAPLLLADEPTAALDPLHAHRTMGLLREFCDRGGGVLAALHDLNLAARFADRVIVLAQGRVIAEGPPADCFTPAVLAQAYGVRAAIRRGPEGVGVDILGPADAD